MSEKMGDFCGAEVPHMKQLLLINWPPGFILMFPFQRFPQLLIPAKYGVKSPGLQLGSN